jgi:putative Ca2+/H+ antiporter (TMEM165/GDT1 family)
MENLLVYLQGIVTYLSLLNISSLSATASTSFLLIAAAEIGDKSQLVCMTLAARHRATPVLLGSIASFAFLNSLAVIFGAAIANWFPDYIVSITVAVLFAVFGVHSLSSNEQEEDEEVIEKSGHSLFFTTFFLITIAEFGDKTQLAVVALSSTAEPVAVWIGATCALILTLALGVIVGRTLLQKCPLTLLHKVSGLIFLVLAVLAAYNSYLSYIKLNGFEIALF